MHLASFIFSAVKAAISHQAGAKRLSLAGDSHVALMSEPRVQRLETQGNGQFILLLFAARDHSDAKNKNQLCPTGHLGLSRGSYEN